MKDKVRLGFIGCGNIAGGHAVKLGKMPGATIVACCDLQEERARAVAQPTGAKVYTQYADMLDHEALDAVLLCTPHTARVEPIRAIAQRKLALFCEKPPAFTIADAQTCIAAIEKAGIINSVGLMYRWAEISDKAREVIAGRPVNICQITGCWSVIDWVTAGGLAPWFLLQERSGGPMMDQGIHLLDAARYMLQDDVTEVHAFGSNYLHPQTPALTIHDTVHANLRFRKGTVGTHAHAWSYKGWIFQIRLIGSDFELVWDIANNRMEGKTRGLEVKYQGRDDCYQTELAGFLNAVRTGDPSGLRSTYADACKSFATTLAAVQSAVSGTVQKVQL